MVSRAFEKEQMLMPLISAAAGRFWSKVGVGTPDECWEWKASVIAAYPGKTKGPKGKFTVKTGGKAYFFISSRFAWLLGKGPIPDGMLVCHRCDNPMCCNPRHLFLGTPKNNAQDMAQKGRILGAARPGEDNFGAKLSKQDVREIKYLSGVQPPLSFTGIGEMYGVSRVAISRIVNSNLWSAVAA